MRTLIALAVLTIMLCSAFAPPAQAAAPPRPGQPYADARCSTDPNIIFCEDFDYAQNFICADATGSQGNNMGWINPGLTTSGKLFPYNYCKAADFPKLNTLGIPAGPASGGVYRANMKNGAASASYDGCILGDCDRNTADMPQTYQNGSAASNDLYFQMAMYHGPQACTQAVTTNCWYWPSTAYGLDNKVLFLYPNKYTSKTDANVDAGLYFNASGRCSGSPQAYPDALSFRVGSNSGSYKWFPAHLSAGTSTEYCPAASVGQAVSGKLYRMPLGQWVTVEFRYKLSTAGQKNGVIEAWIDGTKIYSASNLETCGNYGANEGSCYAIHEIFFEGSWFNPLYGDVAAAQQRGGYRLIDNLIISTAPIGVSGTTPPPPVPDPVQAPTPDPIPTPEPPPAATGAYYTATTGNDSNSCTAAQNPATPKRTIRAGISCLSAGQTLIVKAGTYAEALNNPFSNTGTSWANKITVKADGVVTVKPGNGAEIAADFTNSSQKYVEFDGITIDAASVELYGLRIWGPAHHIRFMNGTIKNAANQGVSILKESGSADGNEFLNVEVTGTAWGRACNGGEGTKDGYCHAFYIGGNNNLLDNVWLHHNNGYGVQFYPQGNSGNVIRNSRSHDNLGTGIGSLGNNNQIVNNVVYNNREGGLLITESGALVAHNTVTGNAGGWGNLTLQGSHQVKNNIILGSISGSIDSTNMTSGNAGFVGGSDYHLTASSPAINRVVCLAQVPTDKDGVTRPQSSACDQGAYEFGGTVPPPPPPPPADTDGDGVPDSSDQCPTQAGPVSNNGCPVVVPPPPIDTDGDGTPDTTDQCPNDAGPASNNGCPIVIPPPPPAVEDRLSVTEDGPDYVILEWDRAKCPGGVSSKTTGTKHKQRTLTCRH